MSTVQDAKSYTVDEALAAGRRRLRGQLARRRAAPGRRPHGRRAAGSRPWSRPPGAPTTDVCHEPVPELPAPAGRPEHRLHPVHARLLRPAVRARPSQLRDRHPGRASRIILAFIGFGSLPLNIAGLLLIGLAIVLFVLELTVTSHGLLTDRRPRRVRAGRGRAVHRSRDPPTAPDVSVSRCR